MPLFDKIAPLLDRDHPIARLIRDVLKDIHYFHWLDVVFYYYSAIKKTWIQKRSIQARQCSILHAEMKRVDEAASAARHENDTGAKIVFIHRFECLQEQATSLWGDLTKRIEGIQARYNQIKDRLMEWKRP